MKTVEATQATTPLGQSARELADESLIVMDNGVPIAALMPIRDEDLESLNLADSPKFWSIIEQARSEYRSGAGLSTEDVRRELGV